MDDIDRVVFILKGGPGSGAPVGNQNAKKPFGAKVHDALFKTKEEFTPEGKEDSKIAEALAVHPKYKDFVRSDYSLGYADNQITQYRSEMNDGLMKNIQYFKTPAGHFVLLRDQKLLRVHRTGAAYDWALKGIEGFKTRYGAKKFLTGLGVPNAEIAWPKEVTSGGPWDSTEGVDRSTLFPKTIDILNSEHPSGDWEWQSLPRSEDDIPALSEPERRRLMRESGRKRVRENE